MGKVFRDEWDARGVRSWGDGWWVLQERVGDQVAGVLGVQKGTVSMHQNIAVALEMILSCFRFDGKRNGIVYADRNFPSDQYIYEARKAHGAKLTRVPAAADGFSTDGEEFASHIDDTRRFNVADILEDEGTPHTTEDNERGKGWRQLLPKKGHRQEHDQE